MKNATEVCVCMGSILLLLLLFAQCEARPPYSVPRLLLYINGEHLSYEIDNPSTAQPNDRRMTRIVDAGTIAKAKRNTTKTSSASTKKECDATYGFLPCSTTLVGNIFLLLVYGYLLYKAARFLSDGSELLLTVMDPGLIGGLLLPILGVLPDSLLILVSGLGGTTEEAQEQILVGIGVVAGSTVMLLTVLWGTCLILGRCDLEEDSGRLIAVDKKLTKGWSLTGTGVTTDYLTKLSSRIMVVTVLPFIVAQLPKIFRFSPTRNIPVLTACVLSLGGLVAYCLYQVLSPRLQERKKAYAKKRAHKLFLLQKFVKLSLPWGSLVNERGQLDMNVVDKMFSSFDLDKDNHLSQQELRYLMNLSMGGKASAWIEEALEHIMAEFDISGDRKISRDEFDTGMKKWLTTIVEREKPFNLEDAEKAAKRAEGDYVEFLDYDEDEEEEKPPTKQQLIRKSVLLLLGGTILAAAAADPLVDAVTGFSKASHIPSFFISFILLPLASNSSEGVSSLMFSSRKRRKNMSLTYSQVYGGVTMNNTMGLGIFLAIVYGRHLIWDFSSEVLVIVLVTVIMGLMAGFRNTFPLWMAGIAIMLYPLSIGLVAILDYAAGWE